MDVIYYYLPALETIRDFMELGGNVLFIIGFLIWMIRSWKKKQVEQPDFEKIKLDTAEENA